MNKKRLTITDDLALSGLQSKPKKEGFYIEYQPDPHDWIRIFRTYFRMPQAELAERAKVSKAHLVGIEKGKYDPRIGTIKKIFAALGCDIVFRPEPKKPVEAILRGRARAIALKSLKQVMGSMSLEAQAPGARDFKRLLEKRTDEILADKRISLRIEKDA